jgi:hypothetical protein
LTGGRLAVLLKLTARTTEKEIPMAKKKKGKKKDKGKKKGKGKKK